LKKIHNKIGVGGWWGKMHRYWMWKKSYTWVPMS